MFLKIRCLGKFKKHFKKFEKPPILFFGVNFKDDFLKTLYEKTFLLKTLGSINIPKCFKVCFTIILGIVFSFFILEK